MKPRSLLMAALVGGATALGTAPTFAQVTPQTPVTTPVNPGFWFWSIGASGGIRHLPKWNYGETYNFGPMGETVNVADAYTYNPKPWGAGPEFVMGYALNRAGPLGGVGDLPRIELGLSTFFGRSNQSSSAGGTGDRFWLPNVDGTVDPLLSFLPNDGVAAKLETTVYSGEAALRFKTSFKVSPRFQIVPSVAAIGGLAFYRYRWQGNFRGIELGGVIADVKETVRSWHAGGEAALLLKWQPNARWSVHAGATIAAMYRRSDMNALSQFNVEFGGIDQNVNTNASDNENTFAWRLGLNLGVTYDWGWARLTISGFGYYDSAVPQIVNPRLNAGQVPDTTGSAARLTHSGEWAYGGRIALVFPIYGARW